MADYLGRLAARALGQLPSVTPRVPARFEPVDDEAPELLEQDTDVFAGVEPLEGAGPRPTGDEPASTVEPLPSRGPEVSVAEARPAGPAAAGDNVAPPPVPSVRVGDVAIVHSEPSRVDGPVEPARAAPLAESRRTPVVPVTPPPPPTPVSRASGGTAVRISIGRIEVRAAPAPAAAPAIVSVSAPAAAPQPAPRAAPPEPAELTLSAYLRGDRGRDR